MIFHPGSVKNNEPECRLCLTAIKLRKKLPLLLERVGVRRF